MLSAPPRWGKLSVGKTSGKQYCIINLVHIRNSPPLPNFTSPSSPSSLNMTGLGVPLGSSVLKRRYISLQNE